MYIVYHVTVIWYNIQYQVTPHFVLPLNKAVFHTSMLVHWEKFKWQCQVANTSTGYLKNETIAVFLSHNRPIPPIPSGIARGRPQFWPSIHFHRGQWQWRRWRRKTCRQPAWAATGPPDPAPPIWPGGHSFHALRLWILRWKHQQDRLFVICTNLQSGSVHLRPGIPRHETKRAEQFKFNLKTSESILPNTLPVTVPLPLQRVLRCSGLNLSWHNLPVILLAVSTVARAVEFIHSLTSSSSCPLDPLKV
jgi:hypothetical protein